MIAHGITSGESADPNVFPTSFFVEEYTSRKTI